MFYFDLFYSPLFEFANSENLFAKKLAAFILMMGLGSEVILIHDVAVNLPQNKIFGTED